MLSASIVRNSRVVLNVGKLYIFISLSTCVRARISSTFCAGKKSLGLGRGGLRSTSDTYRRRSGRRRPQA